MTTPGRSARDASRIALEDIFRWSRREPVTSFANLVDSLSDAGTAATASSQAASLLAVLARRGQATDAAQRLGVTRRHCPQRPPRDRSPGGRRVLPLDETNLEDVT